VTIVIVLYCTYMLLTTSTASIVQYAWMLNHQFKVNSEFRNNIGVASPNSPVPG
jgi:hypothetical protein